MRVADYVAQFIASKNVSHVFTIPGGGCIHLSDAFSKVDNLQLVANHHEQACGLSAEGYARLRGDLGVCLVTSGPGGSNTWTATLCSYQDSVPVMVISGNVNKDLTTNYTGLPLRQLGDQEYNVVRTVQDFTKYAYQVNDPKDIRYHLEQAYYWATNGRPGPVWIDIPLDVQSAQIDTNELEGFDEPDILHFKNKDVAALKELAYKNSLELILRRLKKSKKPLIIAGHGVRLSKSIELLDRILEKHKIPVITSFNGNDSVSNEYEYYCGRFGTHAQIAANTIVQEADFVLSLGSRLYVRQIGYNFKDFARNAFKVYVDIDANELNKPTLFPDITIERDVRDLLEALEPQIEVSNISKWQNYCVKTVKKYPTVLPRHRKAKPVSVYGFMDTLNRFMQSDRPVITSDGSANIVGMQVLKLKKGQRLFSNKSTAPMGYGLPAAIGACFANDKQSVVCLEGDGSLHMNIHELQVMYQHQLPIKLFVINNDGYVSMKITQKTFCNGNMSLSDAKSGLTLPEYKRIAEAYRIPYISITNNSSMPHKIKSALESLGPIIVEVFVDPNEMHEPKVMASIDDNGKFIPGQLDNIKWLS
jgi:acetolactate synthase-1/2/3 large subunit